MAPPSKWWSYFTKIDEKLSVCKVCNKTVRTSGNTTNLKIHYTRQHLARKDDQAEASTSSLTKELKVDGKIINKQPTMVAMATIPNMIRSIKGYEGNNISISSFLITLLLFIYYNL